MMHDVGIEISVQVAYLPYDRDHIERIEAAALPVERMQREAMRLDARSDLVDAGRDMHVVACMLCAASAIGRRCDRKYQSSVTR